jgi:NAD-dependent deacetylase
MVRAIEQAVALLEQADYVSALTGAGISTPSGIPDFRSAGSGLWECADPFEVATIYAFRRSPRVFYDWVRPLARAILYAEPNPAHLALADLERIGVLRAIITQNIDGLHQRASSTVVHELHGHLRQATCIHCYATTPAASLLRAFVESGEIPRCERCDGVMKPDIILYGEQLPVKPLLAAQRVARKSDVMIVVGSSLEVAPAGDLPLLTKRGSGKLIFVNLGPTHLDDIADVVIRQDVAQSLPRLVEALRRTQRSPSGRNR